MEQRSARFRRPGHVFPGETECSRFYRLIKLERSATTYLNEPVNNTACLKERTACYFNNSRNRMLVVPAPVKWREIGLTALPDSRMQSDEAEHFADFIGLIGEVFFISSR